MDKEKQSAEIKRIADLIESFLSWSITAIATVLQVLGWPGFFVLAFFYSISEYATDIQKQQIVDKYVLFEKTSNCSNGLITIFCFFSLVFYIYMRHNHIKHKTFKKELDRCAEEKSRLQNSIGKFKTTRL